MHAVPYILFGAVFTIAVSISLGALLLDRLKVVLHREEYPVLSFVVGAPLLSTIAFLVAAAHVSHKGVFLVIGVAAMGAALAFARVRRIGELPALPPLPRLWKAVFSVIFAAFTLLYFTNAMSPEISPDGSEYHLGLVDHYYRAHGLVPGRNTLYSSLPEGTEMLFLFAYTFGKHSAAAMIHLAFLVALALLIVCWGRRYGYPGAGAAAALLVYASPVVGVDGTSAYNDLTAACTVFALFYALQLWKTESKTAWLIPIGLLAGFCYAVKYTVALAIPYALIYVAWRARKTRPVLIAGACAALVVAPWVAKDWLWVGNPIAPFFNSIFPNPHIHIAFERGYRDEMRHVGNLPGVWSIVWDLTCRGAVLGGLLGPIFLAAPIALLALRRRAGREILATFAFFLLPYFLNIGARFTIPSLPFLAIAMGLALMDFPVLLATIAILHAMISWPMALRVYARGAWRLDRFLLRPALRLVPEDRWLSYCSPTYIGARMIERNVPPGEPVFTLSGTAEAYTTHDIIVRFESAEAETLGKILFAGLSPLGQPTHIEDFRFPPRKLYKLRAMQTTQGRNLWSISEFRLFHGTSELSRDRIRRLRAFPDPWEVQYAFDNSPVTRWSSWQAMSPGMFVEVHLKAPEVVDRVRLECANDQPEAHVVLEGMDKSGLWRTLSEQAETFDVYPARGMRLAATEALKRHGIHYMLTAPADFGYGDYRANAAQWGFSLIQEQGGECLYRLDGAK